VAALAGVNIVYGLGMLGQGITFDYAKLVMDNEIARMIKEVVTGITVNEETLALEVIRQVGAAGEFVSHEHTYKNFRKELSMNKLINRQNRESWLAEGGKDFTERAYEEAERIYKTYQVEPIEPGVAQSMRGIVNEAEAHYGVRLSTE
jgi:trimethylamine--corrinoid protein Co-methyltransferase